MKADGAPLEGVDITLKRDEGVLKVPAGCGAVPWGGREGEGGGVPPVSPRTALAVRHYRRGRPPPPPQAPPVCGAPRGGRGRAGVRPPSLPPSCPASPRGAGQGSRGRAVPCPLVRGPGPVPPPARVAGRGLKMEPGQRHHVRVVAPRAGVGQRCGSPAVSARRPGSPSCCERLRQPEMARLRARRSRARRREPERPPLGAAPRDERAAGGSWPRGWVVPGAGNAASLPLAFACRLVRVAGLIP